MIGTFVAWAGFGNLMQQLEDMQFFAYVLPFLLIFAAVYALLSNIELFKNNRGASVLIALSIGLLALQLNIVSAFFQNISPSFAIGLTILLMLLILAGPFIQGESSYKWIFFGVGVAIMIIIMAVTFANPAFGGSWWWEEYGAMVIVALVVITAMIMVMVGSKK